MADIEINKIKVSELPLKSSAADEDLLIIDDGVNTYSIKKAIFLNGMAKRSESASRIKFVFDQASYKLKAELYDVSDTLISSTDEIDLPLETVVINALYNDTTKCLELKLVNGNSVSVPLTSLIDGLVAKSVYNAAIEAINSNFATLKERVTNNENLSASNKSRLDKHDTTLNKLDLRIKENETAITKNTSDIKTKQNTLIAGKNISIINDEIGVIEGQPVADFFDVDDKGRLCLIYEKED